MTNGQKFDPKDIEENKILGAISYLFILFLIPMLTKKDSAFAMFHARQGLVLFIGWVIIWIVGLIPVLGWIIGFLGTIVLAIVALIALIKALQGEAWEIPLVSEYAKKLKI